jgi:hypothetical protein
MYASGWLMLSRIQKRDEYLGRLAKNLSSTLSLDRLFCSITIKCFSLSVSGLNRQCLEVRFAVVPGGLPAPIRNTRGDIY